MKSNGDNSSRSISAVINHLQEALTINKQKMVHQKLNTCWTILKDIQRVLTAIVSSQPYRIPTDGMKQISQIYQFHQAVVFDVNKLSNNTTAQWQRTQTSNFWLNAKQIIKDTEKEINQRTTRQKQYIQVNKRLDTLKQMMDKLKKGQFEQFQKSNRSFKDLLVGYQIKYNMNYQIVTPIVTQVKSMRDLQYKMIQTVGKIDFKQQQISITGRCIKYFQHCMEKLKQYRNRQFNQQKIKALVYAQDKILTGNTLKITYNYPYNQYLPIDQIQKVLKPTINNQLKVEQLIYKLKSITKQEKKKFYYQSGITNDIPTAILMVQQIQRQLKQIIPIVIGAIDNNTIATNISTTTGLLKYLQSCKKIKICKEENKVMQLQRTTSQTSLQNFWSKSKAEEQMEIYNKIKDQVQDQVVLKYSHQIRTQIRQQIFKQIQIIGTLQWKQLLDKFDNSIQKKNINDHKSVTEDIITKVLQQTGKSLGLPSNMSLYELLNLSARQQPIVQYINNKIKQLPTSFTISGIATTQLPSIHAPTIKTTKYDNNQYKTFSHGRIFDSKQDDLNNQRIDNYSQDQELKKYKKMYQDKERQYSDLSKKKVLDDKTSSIQLQQKLKQIQKYKQEISNLSSALSQVTQKNGQKMNNNQTTYQFITRSNSAKAKQQNTQLINLRQQYTKLLEQKQRCIKKIIQSNSMTIYPGSPVTLYNMVQYLIDRKQEYKRNFKNLSQQIKTTINNINSQGVQTKVVQLIDIQYVIESLVNDETETNKKTNQFDKKMLANLQAIVNRILSLQQYKLPQQQQQSKQQPITEKIQNNLLKINKYFNKTTDSKYRPIQFKSKMFSSSSDEQFVLGKLQQYLNFDIQEYSLLYRSSQGCKPNYVTQSLQKHPNTLLLIKTKLGHTVACYSSLSYCETKDIKNRLGLLIATFSKSAYPLKPGYKPIINSPEYIIFGNQTIKINKDFNNKMLVRLDKYSILQNKQNHDAFNIVGIDKSQVQIQGFQIYQIISKKAQIVSLSNSNIFIKNYNITNDRKTTAQLLNSNKCFDPKMKSQVLPATQRNFSQKKQLQQYQQLKQQVERYQKTIKTLQKKNEELQKQLQKYKNQNITNIQHQTNRNTLGKSQKIGTQQNQQRQKQVSQANQHILQKQEVFKKLKITQQQNQAKINKIKQYEIITSSLSKKILQLQSQLKNKQQQIKSQTQQTQQIIKQYTQKQSQLIKKHKQTQQQLQKIKKDLQAVQLKQNKIIQQINQPQNKQQKEQQQKILSKQKQQQKEHAHEYNQQENSKQIENKQLARLNKQKQLGKEAIQKQQQQLKKLKQQIDKEKTIIRTYLQNKRKLEDQYNKKLRFTNQLAEKQKQVQLKLNAATKQLQAKNKQKQQMDNFMKNMEQNKRESAQIQRRLEQLKNQFEHLNKQQHEKKTQIQKLNYQIRDLKNSKKAEEQLNKKFSEMKASYEIKEKELNKIQQRLKQLQQKQKDQRIRLEQVSNDLKRDEQTHKKKMAILKRQQQQLNLQLSKLQANLRQKKKVNKQSQIQKQKKQITDEKLVHLKAVQEQIICKKEEVQQLETNIAKGIQIKKKLALEQNKNQKKLHESQQRLKQLEIKIHQQTIELAEVELQLLSYNAKMKELKNCREEIQRLHKQKQATKKQLEQFKNIKQLVNREETIVKLSIQSKQQISQIQANIISSNNKNLVPVTQHSRLFIGQIIQDELERQYIVDQLIKLYPKGTVISKTKLMYSFPFMLQIDPHILIDKYSHYIILVKLKNTTKDNKHYLMALYSQLSLKQKANQGKGFISSVTNQQTFYIKNNNKNNPRVTLYNEESFVFGNSEIQIYIGRPTLKTNIGHLYRFFDTPINMKNPEIFTGASEPETQILGYEIYHIVFDCPLE